MPIGVYVDIQGDEIVRRNLQKLGAELVPLTRREIYNQLLGLRNRLTTVGERPTYPINWDSERQKRAFFATDGFGHGIPYGRTGRTARAWRVVRTGNGYTIENPEPHIIYVEGDENMQGQSRIHRGRWPLWAKQLDEYINKVPPEAERAIQQEANKLGF